MQALNWKLNHHMVTVNTWVNTYMQLGSHHLRPSVVKAREFEYPAYSCLEFIRVMQLLDLCMLDIASRQFSSSVLAASAVYLVSERSRAHLEVITGERERKILEALLSSKSCLLLLSPSFLPVLSLPLSLQIDTILSLPPILFFLSVHLPQVASRFSLSLFLPSCHSVSLKLVTIYSPCVCIPICRSWIEWHPCVHELDAALCCCPRSQGTHQAKNIQWGKYNAL